MRSWYPSLAAALSSPLAVILGAVLAVIGAPGMVDDAVTWRDEWLPSLGQALLAFGQSYPGWILSAAGICGLIWHAWMDVRARRKNHGEPDVATAANSDHNTSRSAPALRPFLQYVRERFWLRSAIIVSSLAAVYITAGLIIREAPSKAPATGGADTAQTVEGVSDSEHLEDRVFREFKREFRDYLTVVNTITFHEENPDLSTTMQVRRNIDFNANADFLTFYIPRSPITYIICLGIAQNWEDLVDLRNRMEVTAQNHGDLNVQGEGMVLSKAVYLYTEDALTIRQMADLQSQFREKGLSVQFRHPGTLRLDNNSQAPWDEPSRAPRQSIAIPSP